MQEAPDDTKKHPKKRKDESHDKDQDRLLLEEEEKEHARLRTRGPYRKSSRAGLG